MARRNEKSKAFKRYRSDMSEIVRAMTVLAIEVHGWTVETWAEHSDISPSTIYRLLEGVTRYPQLYTIYRMAQAVGCEIWVQKLEEGRKAAA